MFIGRYYHALEQKKRLSIPKVYRDTLKDGAILTGGLDGCLFLYPSGAWQALIREAQDLPVTKKAYRDWVRLLANNASAVDFDPLGRILIPEHLLLRAKIVKAVAIVGSLNHLEIWDRDSYHAYFDSLENQAESIAESIYETHSSPA